MNTFVVLGSLGISTQCWDLSGYISTVYTSTWHLARWDSGAASWGAGPRSHLWATALYSLSAAPLSAWGLVPPAWCRASPQHSPQLTAVLLYCTQLWKPPDTAHSLSSSCPFIPITLNRSNPKWTNRTELDLVIQRVITQERGGCIKLSWFIFHATKLLSRRINPRWSANLKPPE